MKKIAFIGIGVMGAPIVGHLADAGYQVHIFNRTKSKAQAIANSNIIVHDSISSCVQDVQTVCTMVGYPSDVASIYLGSEGIIDSVSENTLLIDLTTSSPTLAKEIAYAAQQKNCLAIDAPVSGGDIGAKKGTLSIMVGGSPEGFERAKPILSVFGSKITHQGSHGAGQHTKMANQISVAGNLAATVESLVYAIKCGLDPQSVLNAVTAGAGNSWQLEHNGQHIINNHMDPGFYIKHFIKDMRIAKEEASYFGMKLKVLMQVCEMFESLAEVGYENLGTQALIKYYIES